MKKVSSEWKIYSETHKTVEKKLEDYSFSEMGLFAFNKNYFVFSSKLLLESDRRLSIPQFAFTPF